MRSFLVIPKGTEFLVRMTEAFGNNDTPAYNVPWQDKMTGNAGTYTIHQRFVILKEVVF